MPTDAKLNSFLDLDKNSKHHANSPVLAYLFADPAAHSLSPSMHNAAFAAAGLVGRYQALRVPVVELASVVEQMRGSALLGANLSLPHKESVLPLLDEILPAAQEIGAVNTIVHQEGRLLGDNTDAAGFLAALAEADAPTDGLAVVLGAGGAARAAVWALQSQAKQSQSPRTLLVLNRSYQKAKQLTQQLGGQAVTADEVPWDQVKLLINATSVGLGNNRHTPLLQWPQLHSQALVYDMIYTPIQTRLLREAEAAGLSTANGLSMLAHQARLAFRAWTGHEVSVQVFTQALLTAVSSKSLESI